MSKTDRNAPCPCGSGKKYKRCCLAKSEAAMRPIADPAVAAMHDLTDAVLRFARRQHGLEVEDLLAFVPAVALDDDSAPLWFELVAFHEGGTGRPVAGDYIQRPVPASHVELCRQRMAAVPALLEIVEVRPGVGVRALDHLTGEELEVRDAMISQTSSVGMVGLALVYAHDGEWRISGAHALLLAPAHGAEAITTVRQALKLRGKRMLTREKLGEWTTKVLVATAWTIAARAWSEPVEPGLCNTDGDPLLLIRERYVAGGGSLSALIDRLASIEGASEPEETDEGTVVRILRQGNAMHGSWDNTVMARIVVERAGSVVIETNSERRADDARARFEAACGALVTRRPREVQDAWSAVEQHRAAGGGSKPSGIPPEEEGRVVREYKERHYSDWADVPLPALDGRTPRAASKAGPAMRKRLEVLLRDMAFHESRLPETHRFDFAPIFRELGLSPDTRG